jgi:hypothetical protein
MILVALMFVFGAWNVQHFAELPSQAWLVCASLVVIAILITQIHPRFSSNSHLHNFFKSTLLCSAAFLFGVVWAGGFAYWRMSDELPHAWLASSLPEDADIPVAQKKIQCFTGQNWTWDGVQFEILHPSAESYENDTIKDNDRSCVLKVTSQAGSILLTGDI